MLIKSLTFFMWLGVSASSVYWGLLIFNPPSQASQASVAMVPEAKGDWVKVLGTIKAPAPFSKPSTSANEFKLLGLAAATQAGQKHGVALLSFQDQPARSYKVGTPINDRLMVVDISKQRVTIGLAQDPKNEKEHIFLEAALLPKAEASKEPPSGTSNNKNPMNTQYGGMRPTPQPAYPNYPQPPANNYSTPSYGANNPTSYNRRAMPSAGMEPPPPSAYNPEIGGTQGYPSPPPTDNPMY